LLILIKKGKGIAALTFDKDYQKKRQELMNQQPSNIPAGLAQGGRGFFLVINYFFLLCMIIIKIYIVLIIGLKLIRVLWKV